MTPTDPDPASDVFEPDGVGLTPPDPGDASARAQLFIPRRNLGLAYFCLILLGWLGVHRFYVRRPYSAVLYALTLGFLGVGLVLDLLLLPRLVRTANERLEQQAAADPERFLQRERIAPWATESAGKWSPQLLLVAGFWLLGAPIFTLMMTMGGFSTGPLYLALTLVLLALFGSPHRLLESYPRLKRVPILDVLLARLVELEDYYYEHKPRMLIYYLAYPLAAPIAAIFSRRARHEARMFTRALGIIAGVLAVNMISTYSFTFSEDSISTTEAVAQILILFLISFISLVLYIVPTTSTAFSLNLSGRRSQTLVFAAIGGGLSVPAWLLSQQMLTHRLTLPYELLLDTRFKGRAFQCEFEDLSRMFLRHEVLALTAGGSNPDALGGALEVTYDKDRTEKLRRILGGFTSDGEKRAFTVATMTWSEGPTFLAVVRDNDPIRDRENLERAETLVCNAQPLVVVGRGHEFLTTASLEQAFPGAVEALGPLFHREGELLLYEDWLKRCSGAKEPLVVAEHCWGADGVE